MSKESSVVLPPGVREFNATLPGMLLHRARTTPQRLALRQKQRGIWRRYTWHDYFVHVRRFALYLQSQGFTAGDKLVIASDNSVEWFFADLAAQSLGGVTVGIYPTNPWPELQYIVRHCRAKVALCGDQEQTDKILDAMKNGDGLPDLERIITVDPKGMRHYGDERIAIFAHALDIGHRLEMEAGRSECFEVGIEALIPTQDALIVYTSGTTGMPKGARLSHRSIATNALALGQAHGYGNKPPLSVVCYLPLCHVAERLMSLAVQLVYGSEVNFAESIDAVVNDLREIGPTYFLGVPRIWEKLQHSILMRSKEARPLGRHCFERALAIATGIAERALANGGRPATLRDALVQKLLQIVIFRNTLASIGLDRVETAMTGGAALSPEVILYFRALGVPIYQIYGMTESSGATHSQVPGQTGLGESGPPLPFVEQRLADDGELLIRGPIVFSGYLYDEAATASTIDGGWLKTGDIVEISPQSGAVRVVDRKKAIIITSGGKNITPSLIENELKKSVYIEEAVLIGDGRHFISALIQIDLETVGKWAQEKGLAYTNYQSLASLPEVERLIDAEVAEVNSRFSRVENIRKFVILRKQLDHDDGEMTATMKVRRSAIERKFAREIETIYGRGAVAA